MKVHVHFDDLGQIVSVAEVHDSEGDRPQAGILLPRTFSLLEADVADDEPLIVVHTAHRIDVRGREPRLTRIERDSGGRTSA
jgi:hypothetical protein